MNKEEEKQFKLTELEQNLLGALEWHNKDVCLENESYEHGIIALIESLRENYISKSELDIMLEEERLEAIGDGIKMGIENYKSEVKEKIEEELSYTNDPNIEIALEDLKNRLGLDK